MPLTKAELEKNFIHKKGFMKLINMVGVDSIFGYRTIDIRLGDITDMPPTQDLLVVSAFANDYQATRTSVIGALEDKNGFSLEKESKDIYLDLRDALSIWLTKETTDQFFKRVLCVEIMGTGFKLEEIMKNLFAGVLLFEAKGIETTSMTLPILATGDQQLDPGTVIQEMLPPAIETLQRSPSLNRISFVSRDPKIAEALDQAINEYLGREEIQLPKDDLIKDLKKGIQQRATKALATYPQSDLFNEIHEVFRRTECRSFEVGILARRLVEFAVDDLIAKKSRSKDLFQKIELLPNQKIAAWISSYMHVLRIFGNESAHERDRDRMPKQLSEEDFMISLFCMSRVLEFWIDSKSKRIR